MSARTRKNNQKKRRARSERTLAALKIRDLWSRAHGMSVYDFARRHRSEILASDAMYVEFIRDMMKNRIRLDIKQLVPDEPALNIKWMDAADLEDVLTQFADMRITAKLQNCIWPLPDAPPWNEIRDLCRAMAERPDPIKRERLIELLNEVEARVEAQGDFIYNGDNGEKFFSLPLYYKRKTGKKLGRSTAAAPHSDPAVVILFMWRGGGTLLFSNGIFRKLPGFRHVLPFETRPIAAQEIPEFCLLLMPPGNLHAASQKIIETPFDRSFSRAFAKNGQRVEDGKARFYDELRIDLDRFNAPSLVATPRPANIDDRRETITVPEIV